MSSHPSLDPKIMARREKEYAAAETSDDVARLQRKWEAEDDAIIRSRDYNSRELDDLRRRVNQLERDRGRGIDEAFVKATGRAAADAIKAAFEARSVMCYLPMHLLDDFVNVTHRGVQGLVVAQALFLQKVYHALDKLRDERGLVLESELSDTARQPGYTVLYGCHRLSPLVIRSSSASILFMDGLDLLAELGALMGYDLG
jgi:hypothetical protein